MREAGHLTTALEAAVPLRIAEIRRLGHDVWVQTVEQRRVVWAEAIASRADVLMFGGGKKGEVATLFGQAVDAIAHLAFAPGGVKLFGCHFEATFE